MLQMEAHLYEPVRTLEVMERETIVENPREGQ